MKIALKKIRHGFEEKFLYKTFNRLHFILNHVVKIEMHISGDKYFLKSTENFKKLVTKN